ncbi:MAG: hypothetical protein NTX45_07910 [Proteobacteria bacterium]|nr:hypothetical protein [Pseudomonadota bacterium]
MESGFLGLQLLGFCFASSGLEFLLYRLLAHISHSPPPCGGQIRPGVVWFGETLPEEAWNAAQQAAQNCDLLFSIGTSSVVWPAAQLPETAARNGAAVVQINPEPTTLDRSARFNLRGKAGDILPTLLEAL